MDNGNELSNISYQYSYIKDAIAILKIKNYKEFKLILMCFDFFLFILGKNIFKSCFIGGLWDKIPS